MSRCIDSDRMKEALELILEEGLDGLAQAISIIINEAMEVERIQRAETQGAGGALRFQALRFLRFRVSVRSSFRSFPATKNSPGRTGCFSSGNDRDGNQGWEAHRARG